MDNLAEIYKTLATHFMKKMIHKLNWINKKGNFYIETEYIHVKIENMDLFSPNE